MQVVNLKSNILITILIIKQMDTNQKINQIIQALQMQESVKDPTTNFVTSTPTITGDDRKTLVSALVKLLTTV
jgi:hypothetical protein